mmetsp:Transcript_24194/g.60432  ORF Transcript_24194/g.60432 Transcript_24194/m.60432 type:complete len:252 (-) Transcript_24194:798-1553(-)
MFENSCVDASRALVLSTMLLKLCLAASIAPLVRLRTVFIKARLAFISCSSLPACMACSSHRRLTSAALDCSPSTSRSTPPKLFTTCCTPSALTGASLSSIAWTFNKIPCVSSFFRNAVSISCCKLKACPPPAAAPPPALATCTRAKGVSSSSTCGTSTSSTNSSPGPTTTCSSFSIKSGSVSSFCSTALSARYLPRNKSTSSCKVLCWRCLIDRISSTRLAFFPMLSCTLPWNSLSMRKTASAKVMLKASS